MFQTAFTKIIILCRFSLNWNSFLQNGLFSRIVFAAMTKLTDDLLNDNSGQYSDTDESNERTPLCPDGNMNTKLSHYTVPQCEGAYNSMEPSPPILTGKSTARIVSVDVDNTNHQSASSQEDSEDCSPSRVVYVDGLLGYQHMNGIIPAGANKLEGIDYERDIEVGNGSNDLNDAADGAASIEDKERWRDPGEETWYRIMLETSFPFFSAGMGMVFAGVVLGVVQVVSNQAFYSIIDFYCA